MAASSSQTKNSFEYLKENFSGIPLYMFSELKNVSSQVLNALFEIIGKIYSFTKDNVSLVLSKLLSVYNFYLRTREAKSLTSLSVGFLDLMNSLFGFDKIPKLFRIVSELISTYFQSLSKYFLKAESYEKMVGDFWKFADMSDPRMILNVVWELCGVTATCSLLADLARSGIKTSSLSELVASLNKHFLDSRSEIRLRLTDASQAIARIFDFIVLNYPYIIKCEFNNITWTVPAPLKFENDYAAFRALYQHYLENPEVLRENNLTVCNLRDQASDLIKIANKEIMKTNQGPLKSSMVKYLEVLNDAHIYLCEQLNPNNTKPQPLSITLCGPAGCGKSSLATNLGKLMQTVVGRIPDEDKIKNRGGDPKFEPAITSGTEVIISDDFGNDTGRRIPTKEVLDIVNVTKEIIPKASVQEKNRHKYSNIGTIFTTNDTDIGIGSIQTISFDSILRRFGLVVFMKPKEEYCQPGSDVLDRHHPYLADGVPRSDIYEIEIKKPLGVVSLKGNQYIDYAPIENWKAEGLNDMQSLIIYLRSHFAKEWKKNLSQHENRSSGKYTCQKCGLADFVCVCDCYNKLQPESLPNVDKYYTYFHEGFYSSSEHIKQRYIAFDSYSQLRFDTLSRKLTMVMYYFYLARYFTNYVLWIRENKIPIIGLYLVGFIPLLYCNYAFGMCYIFLLFGTPFYLYNRRNRLQREYLQNRHIARGDFIREHYYSRMIFYSTVTFSGLLLSFMATLKISSYIFKRSSEGNRYNVSDEAYLPQFKPTNEDSKFIRFFKSKPQEKAITSSREEAVQYISKKLLIARIEAENHWQEVIAIPSGSEILLPAHSLPKGKNFDITICADNTKRTSSYVSRDIPADNYRQLKDRNGNLVDAVLLNVPNIPVQADLFKYFTCHSQESSGPGQEIFKQLDGTSQIIDLFLSRPGFTTITDYNGLDFGTFRKYPAIQCRSENFQSKAGMCGSPIVSENSNCILGIHVAGNETTTWFGLRITMDMVEQARSSLKEDSKCFVSHPIPPKFTVGRTNNNGFEFLPESETLAVEAIGETMSPIEEIGMITKHGSVYVDRAQRHYFPNKNPNLEVAFGPRVTRPPEFPNGLEQINSTLKKLHKPKFNVPVDLINRSAEDYLEEGYYNTFDNIVHELRKDRKDFFSVRSVEEACKGDNSGIVRGMNNNSSAGWIYGGKKTSHYDKDVEGDYLAIRKLSPEVQRDVKFQEMEWRASRGTYDPFKRSSKTNELLPWKKAGEKTRSFYGNDMTYFINSTRGIIPLKHVLRKDQRHSECFVGIVAPSKEWGHLKNHLSKNGRYTNFVCGDFSGYDTQLPKALLDKACWILLEIAKRGGMSYSDREFLRGALSSVVSPTLFWQGHVLRMANGQPSGQPLTVEVNSIVNSLLMRMTYYTIMDEHYPHLSSSSFRDYVSLATYGDDNALGVDSSIPKYNHTNIQEVFARWGISYTMADKEADSVPYQSIEEISFLKRVFMEHPELGLVGPIEKESITKCFYYWVRPVNTPLTFPQQFGEFIKSQAREAALWGQGYYDEFLLGVKLLQEGSLEMGTEFQIKWSQCQILSYDEMIKELKVSYE